MSAAVSYACRNKLGVPDVGIRMKAVAGSKIYGNCIWPGVVIMALFPSVIIMYRALIKL
jgi:hypothetical protein